ncbi:MAG: hypothetical protein HQ579_02745, partial [Candidatus Omnitrophica bacterium]|nr:hypothetical protein [Candidatus Omnitrophota bacterium]
MNKQKHSLNTQGIGRRNILCRIVVVAAFCFFLFSQFYSIYFRWYNHYGPLGLGDSDGYISRIAYFKDHSLFRKAGLHDITDKYRNVRLGQNGKVPDECVRDFYTFYGITSAMALGKLASLIDISAEKMFQYNFYIGIFLAGLVLFLILKNIGTYPVTVAVGFIIFAFASGTGHYHGFFWVVPSFYGVVFWLLTFY